MSADRGSDREAVRSEGFDLAEATALVVVLAVGVFLRVFRLDELPPGLHQDEAVYGLNALAIILGRLQIYFGEREPLYMYLVAGMSLLLGPQPLALRLTSAIVGSLAVLTTYLAARSLFGRRPALLAGATIAVALWPVMISRVGFRAGTLPLLETASLYFLWEGWQRRSRLRLLLGGALLGGSLYTYIASRFFPVALGVFLAIQLVTGRAFFRRRRGSLGLATLAAAVTFAPLGWYFLRHPEALLGRPAQVAAVGVDSASAAGLMELVLNAGRTLGMFFAEGDANWRHNLPGEPAFVLPVAILMVLGYAVALARWRQPAHLLLVVWLPVMLLPGCLSIDAPHYLRTLGSAPAAAIAVGVGLSTLVDGLTALASRAPSRIGRVTDGGGAHGLLAGSPRWPALLALVLALSPGVATFRAYQVTWASRQEAYEAFNYGLAAAGRYLADSELWRSGQGSVYVTSRFHADRASMTYFLWPYLTDSERLGWNEANLRVRWFDEDRTLPIPARGEAVYVVSPQARRSDLLALWHAVGLAEKAGVESPLGFASLSAYLRPGGAPAEPARALLAQGEDGLDLVGYTPGDPVPSGDTAVLALYWRASGRPPAIAPSVFCHMVDDSRRSLAQDDQVLGYAPSQWVQGDTVITWHRLAIPPGLPPGEYTAEVGLYDKASGRRQTLRVEGRADSRVLVSPIRVLRGSASAADVRPAHVVDKQLTPDLRLLGFDRADEPVAPGSALPLTLYWLATGQPSEYLIELGLRAEDGKERGSQRVHPAGARYPTSGWRRGELVRGDVDLRVAPATPTGTYVGFVRLLTAAGSGVGEVLLGEIQVAGLARVFDPPSPRRLLRVRLGDLAELYGYDLTTEAVRAGAPVRLTLYWRALAETRVGYTVFVHLIDSHERIWGQQDNPPARGARPTNTWVPGEFVSDEYEVSVSPDAPPGDYRLEVGLYDPTTGRRLPIGDERSRPLGDRVLLEPEVRVTQ